MMHRGEMVVAIEFVTRVIPSYVHPHRPVPREQERLFGSRGDDRRADKE
jgi:hypothetical protein